MVKLCVWDDKKMIKEVLRTIGLECTSYFKKDSTRQIFALMSTSHRGLRVKYHDTVRVRHNQEEYFIERSLKPNAQCSTNTKFIDNTYTM